MPLTCLQKPIRRQSGVNHGPRPATAGQVPPSMRAPAQQLGPPADEARPHQDATPPT